MTPFGVAIDFSRPTRSAIDPGSASRESLFGASRRVISASRVGGRLCFLKIEMMTSSINNPSRAELENAVRSWIDECIWRREVQIHQRGVRATWRLRCRSIVHISFGYTTDPLE